MSTTKTIACPRCMPPGDPYCPYCEGAYEVSVPVVSMNKELEQQAREWLNSEGYMHLGLRLTKRGHNGDSDLPERVLAAFAAHLEAQSKPIQGEVDRWVPDEKFIDTIMLHVQVAVSEYDPFPEQVDERDFLANIRGNLSIEFGIEPPPNGEKVYWTTPSPQ